MASIARSPEAGEPLGPLPRQFAAFIRPELPGLLHEIRVEVTRAYPVYGRLFNGPDGDAIRQGVEHTLAAFVDRVANPGQSSGPRDELLRRFGRVEAYEGRDLETLQSAYRLGARIALRRAKTVGRQYNLSPALVLTFADALFAYVEELEAITREGYVEVRERSASEVSALRRQLLHLILAAPPLPRATVSELCEAAAWELPRECTLVALRPPVPHHIQADLDGDVLADLDIPQPYLLVPGALTPQRLTMLGTALAGTRAVVGLTVPLTQTADSVRWARRVLQLIDDGVVPDAPLVHCADHLTTLWLLSDPALVDHLAARELAPLDGLSPSRRDRLVETLRVHVSTRAPAEQVGEMLGVHAQTVRYRLRNLDGHLGDSLSDPDHRFALEAALRALHLRGRAGRE
ncbi:helix-turn-helix domain-containing protein [Streptomyces prasinopilosus]|uniref:PucR C-terminal helix-turn-helix domain-containing protein n=1 Tax=Streptomyces prasinopilosus TaxID=67344 RepID=A0A1G6J8B3_9ACTN|nr:PucR family transcriptional regulator [Streptomyces prasinopilosus]SDC14585.1 PucR C-terminal helix-turn-helix domain-containing protein [Streptomyces prasinopilosus]